MINNDDGDNYTRYVEEVYKKLNPSSTVIRVYPVENLPTVDVIPKLWECGLLKVD